MNDESSAEFAAALASLKSQRQHARAWDVFRDWALGEGFARGELMAFDTELEAARKRRVASDRIERERASFFSANRSQFLGRDALLGDLQLSWRRGFIERAVVPNVGVHLDCLRELSTHPSGALLDSLECSPRELRAYLEAGPRELRALTLRSPTVQSGEVNFDGASGQRRPRVELLADQLEEDLAELTRRLPSLEELILQAPIALDLGRFESSRLKELVFATVGWAELYLSGTASILERCPAVQRFVAASTAPGSLRVVRERKVKTLELDRFIAETARVLDESPLHVNTLDLRSAETWNLSEQSLAQWLRNKPRVRRVLVARNASASLRERVKRFNESR